MNRRKSGVTWIELLVVIVILAVLALVFLPRLNRRHGGPQRSGCQMNLKNWTRVLSMYADENPEQKYPYMHIVDRKKMKEHPESTQCLMPLFMPQLDLLYPDLIEDYSILFCPSQIGGRDEYIDTISEKGASGLYEKYQGCHYGYVYLGWIFDHLEGEPAEEINNFPALSMMMQTFGSSTAAEIESTYVTPQFAAGVDALFYSLLKGAEAENPGQYFLRTADSDLKRLSHSCGYEDDVIHRIAKGAERFYITDHHDPGAAAMFQSAKFVMMDTYGVSGNYFNHKPYGCNVLFLDGHCEYVRFVEGDPGPDIDAGSRVPVLPGMAPVVEYLIHVRDGGYLEPLKKVGKTKQ